MRVSLVPHRRDLRHHRILLGFQIGALRVEVEIEMIVYPAQRWPAVGRFGGPESTHEDFPLKRAIG
jgi:hypothetical protein